MCKFLEFIHISRCLKRAPIYAVLRIRCEILVPQFSYETPCNLKFTCMSIYFYFIQKLSLPMQVLNIFYAQCVQIFYQYSVFVHCILKAVLKNLVNMTRYKLQIVKKDIMISLYNLFIIPT